jgi:hypothetical protein
LEGITWDVLVGIAVIGLLALVVESLRKRGPATWGFGRWVWSLMGLAILVQEATWKGYILLESAAQERKLGVDPVHDLFALWDLRQSLPGLAWLPLVFWISSRLARRPGDPKPDGREWAGRVFGVVVPLLWVGFGLIKLALVYG